jgi:4-hydroxy-tetrahydrodipicolinate synthase
MFVETSPTPVKTALCMMGMMTPEVRLPLYEMQIENAKKLQNGMRKAGLL